MHSTLELRTLLYFSTSLLLYSSTSLLFYFSTLLLVVKFRNMLGSHELHRGTPHASLLFTLLVKLRYICQISLIVGLEVYDQHSNPIANTENESDICYGDVPVKIAFYPAEAVAKRCMLDFSGIWIGNIPPATFIYGFIIHIWIWSTNSN